MDWELRNAAHKAVQAVDWMLGAQFDVDHGIDVVENLRRAEECLSAAHQHLATFRAKRDAKVA